MTRAIVLLGLLTAELLAVSFSFDARSQDAVHPPGSWMAYLAYAGDLAKVLSVTAAAMLLLTAPRLGEYGRALQQQARPPGRFVLLTGLHLLAALLFFVVTGALFSVPTVIDEDSRAGVVLLWLLSGVTLVASWGLALAPAAFWRAFATREWLTLLAAVVTGAAASLFAERSQQLWDQLAYAALILSHGTLTLIYDDVYLDLDMLALGVKDFVVLVGRQCSGYEGIGLISLFTALYLYVFRQEFRFPQALWLLPIGILTIWLFNILRIVVLITLGAEVSPDLALGGFHSQAGWVSFLLVSLGLLFLMHRSGFAAATTTASGFVPLRESLPAATLVPLLAVLAAALLSGLFSTSIDPLYGLRVVAGAVALAAFWQTLALPRLQFSLEPIAVGIAVFVLWVLLVQPDPQVEATTQSALQAMPPLMLGLWLGTRAIGAVIIAPLVEELAFRGYLLARLGGQDVILNGRIARSWLALAVSSLLFGVLHDAWLAGTLAGLAYGLVRLRSDSIWAPILSHGVTNLLLAFYVPITGNWSLW